MDSKIINLPNGTTAIGLNHAATIGYFNNIYDFQLEEAPVYNGRLRACFYCGTMLHISTERCPSCGARDWPKKKGF